MYRDKLNSSKEMKEIEAKLYLVATPIGNLEDITLRALRILQEVPYIACEDTRVTSKLLNFYQIHNKKLIIYNDYSNENDRNRIINLLQQNKSIALVSDAGTPLISDPGYKLVQQIRNAEYKVEVLPGPCSIINALLMTSMGTDKFFFTGFAPNKSGKRCNFLQKLKKVDGTIVLFERADRCKDLLQDCLTVFNDVDVAIIREMTKIYEEVLEGPITTVMHLINHIKGEVVVLVDVRKKESHLDVDQELLFIDEIKEMFGKNFTTKDIVNSLVHLHGVNKKLAYKQVLKSLALISLSNEV